MKLYISMYWNDTTLLEFMHSKQDVNHSHESSYVTFINSAPMKMGENTGYTVELEDTEFQIEQAIVVRSKMENTGELETAKREGFQ